jgi:hypothetical protein
MGLFRKNDNVFENGTHGGPECVIIINNPALKGTGYVVLIR